jgi:two-component system chemotaxis response regulator CheY
VPKKIFIVDDADFIVDMLKLIVQGAGYEVVGTALDGVKALDLMGKLDEASLPDVVTVDFHMPKMDGMEAIRKIRALIPGVKVVLVSSHATFPVVMQAKDAGVDAFIAKPFEPRTILDTLGKLA